MVYSLGDRRGRNVATMVVFGVFLALAVAFIDAVSLLFSVLLGSVDILRVL